MNETINNPDEYIKTLPVKVQNFIYNGNWQQRVTEIAKKYGLSDEQTNSLLEIVVLTLIGLEKPETFLLSITNDLAISDLLSEQIVGDLETRVFEYALKQVEGDTPRVISKEPVLVSKEAPSKIPEIRPVNLPMNQVANQTLNLNQKQTLNQPLNQPKETMVGNNFIPTPKTAFQNYTLDKQKTNEPPAIGVPRYADSKINPVVEKKFNAVTPPITPQIKESVVKYEKDPYREPLG